MIVSFPILVGVLLGVVGPAAALAVCSSLVARTAARRSPETALAVARQIATYGWVGIGIASLCIVVGLGGMTFTFINKWGEEAAAVFGATALTGCLVALAQSLTFRLAGLVRGVIDSSHDNFELTIDRAVGYMERTVWAAAVAPVVVVSILIIALLPLTLLLLVFGLPAVFWQRRRARESQLLWALALAARHNRSLATEIRRHARAWGGNYACRLRELAVYLESGRDLGFALQMVPTALPAYCLSAIRAGEEAGTLPQTLTEVAKEHVRRMRDRYRMGSPGSLIFQIAGYGMVCLGIVAFLMVWIVPKIKAIFEGFGTDLPQITEQFLVVSDFAASFFFLFVWLPIPFIAFAYLNQRGWHTLKLRIFAWFYPEFDAAGVLRHLAITVERERPVSQGFLSLANCHYRPTVQETMARIYVDVESGNDPWTQLYRRRFVNSRDLAVIQTAQQVGNLPWALREIASLNERRMEYRLGILMQFARPAVVLAMGACVAFICVAMFMPLVKLLNDLS